MSVRVCERKHGPLSVVCSSCARRCSAGRSVVPPGRGAAPGLTFALRAALTLPPLKLLRCSALGGVQGEAAGAALPLRLLLFIRTDGVETRKASTFPPEQWSCLISTRVLAAALFLKFFLFFEQTGRINAAIFKPFFLSCINLKGIRRCITEISE